MEKSNKWIKRVVAAMAIAIFGAGAFVGGAALTEKQAQTKYEQILEEEKQSAVDEYKQTINIGYSEEQVQERENVAREEGRQEGLTEGYENGYNQCLKDFEDAGSEENTVALNELLNLYSTGKTKTVSLTEDINLVSASATGVQYGAYLHNKTKNIVSKIMDVGFAYAATTIEDADGTKHHYISSTNSAVLGLWVAKTTNEGDVDVSAKKLMDVGYNYEVGEAPNKAYKVCASASGVICMNSADEKLNEFTGDYSGKYIEVLNNSFVVGNTSANGTSYVFSVIGSEVKELSAVSGYVKDLVGHESYDIYNFWAGSGTKVGTIVKVDASGMLEHVVSGSYLYCIHAVDNLLVYAKSGNGAPIKVNTETFVVEELQANNLTVVSTGTVSYLTVCANSLIGLTEADTGLYYIGLIDKECNLTVITEATKTRYNGTASNIIEDTAEYVVVKYISQEDGLTYHLKYTYATGASEKTLVE